ncbi:MAG: hypothetical protein ACRERX_07640 [Pseudomonas sp.]
MTYSGNAKRIRPEDLRVADGAQPLWPRGTELVPVVGDRVYCTAGLAEVKRLLGKATDGTRILELKLMDVVAAPFFAAASNVLVAPRSAI